jgi:hypothetical protein
MLCEEASWIIDHDNIFTIQSYVDFFTHVRPRRVVEGRHSFQQQKVHILILIYIYNLLAHFLCVMKLSLTISLKFMSLTSWKWNAPKVFLFGISILEKLQYLYDK